MDKNKYIKLVEDKMASLHYLIHDSIHPDDFKKAVHEVAIEIAEIDRKVEVEVSFKEDHPAFKKLLGIYTLKDVEEAYNQGKLDGDSCPY